MMRRNLILRLWTAVPMVVSEWAASAAEGKGSSRAGPQSHCGMDRPFRLWRLAEES